RASPPATPTSKAQKTRPLRILLVDDHTDTVITLGALLRNLGYDVACAETVKQALELAKESRFDLLVSDIGLPDGSGHDLMRQIRARQSIAGIALSGFGMEDDLEKSRAVGFTDHLIKPVNVDRLQATLRDRAGTTGNQLICGADFDNFAWSAPDRQSNGTAANAAVFDQVLLALGSVHLQGKGFSAMWTANISRHRQLHL